MSIGDTLSIGPTRHVFIITSDQGPYVVKADSDPRADLADHEHLEVLEFLGKRNFPHAPALLRTKAGQRVVRIRESIVCVLEHIPLAVPDDRFPAQTWSRLGEAVAQLNACRDYPRPFAIPLRPVLAQLAHRARGQPFEPSFLGLLRRVAGLEHLAPEALVHGEVNLANARARSDGTVVLMDWDEAGTGPAALDYGYPLITVFVSEGDLTFDELSASAFYGSYAGSGGVISQRHVFDAALFHALRYMWWGDQQQRWDRIVHALSNESDIRSVLP